MLTLIQTLGCYIRKEPFPDIVDSLSIACAKVSLTPGEMVANQLAEISSRYCRIRAGMYSGVISPTEALKLLNQLTEELSLWPASVPVAYEIKRVSAADNSCAYGQYFNLYTNHWVTEMWNTYHSLWLMASDSKLHALNDQRATSLGSPLELDVEEARAIVASEDEHRNEICASVPYLVDYPRFMQSQNTAINMAVYSPMTICWPLFDAACGDRAPAALRDWAVGILDHLERRTGLRLAGATAQALRDNMAGPH